MHSVASRQNNSRALQRHLSMEAQININLNDILFALAVKIKIKYLFTKDLLWVIVI